MPGMMPSRKVGAGGLAGALTTLLVGVLSMNGVELSAEMSAALATIFTFVVAYMVPERASEASK